MDKFPQAAARLAAKDHQLYLELMEKQRTCKHKYWQEGDSNWGHHHTILEVPICKSCGTAENDGEEAWNRLVRPYLSS